MRLLTTRLLSVRRGLPLFLAIVVCLAIWQVWLTWRLMEQDRNIAAQHSRERLEQVADLAVAQLTSLLTNWDLSLRELETLPPANPFRTNLPPGGAVILLKSESIATYPIQALLFTPARPSASSEFQGSFEMANQLEFRDQRYNAAIEALQRLELRPALRPEALMRIARLDRKLNRPAAALTAYERISRETTLSPSGVPYGLLAAGARCELLASSGDSTRAAAEAQLLRGALLEGRWPVTRDTFAFYWTEANRLQHKAEEPPERELEFSSLVAQLYNQWQRAALTGSTLSGRSAGPDSSLLIWHATPSRLSALFAPAGWLNASLKLPANSGDVRWKWLSSGSTKGAERHVLRSLAEAQLAGKIDFSSVSGVSVRGLNQVLWVTGVTLMLLLVVAGAYATNRGVSRELRVAQLQSDFVAAVSHEFRSPLTTLRTLTELLAHERITEESRRRQSYTFMERETVRLHRLVEDLLDFGRMESGRKQYRMEAHDAFQLVQAAVADFSEEAGATGTHIETSFGSRSATIRADEEAFRRALRNLLENAVKYSPECRTIWVDSAVSDHRVAISVRDQGMGIDAREQREIFQKFVRGNAAKKAGIKGTGIGLSMVRQIVEAQGGEIHLESTVGNGSTFTILLPLINES